MNLQIKNLGPIKSGEINLDKRFYVFVGYNNSGKTYVSQLLWGVFDDDFLKPFIIKSKILSKLDVSTNDSFQITDSLITSLCSEFQLYIQNESLPQILRIKKTENFILNNLSLFFTNIDILKIKNDGYRDDYKVFQQNKLVAQTTLLKKKGSLRVTFEEKKLDADNYKDWLLPKDRYNPRKLLIGRAIFKTLLNKQEPFFLPSNRTFFPNYFNYIQVAARKNQEVLSDLLSNRTKDSKEFTSENAIQSLLNIPYSKATEQLVSSIENLTSANGGNSHYSDLIQELEEVLGGKITNELNTVEGISANMEFGLNLNKDNLKLPIKLASSSANQLTTLYLYLKYWAKPSNNFLIIDEPEQNLHPKNQIALLDILMKFANKNNNRVLINTHSPLMTEAINNHLHLGYLKDKMTEEKLTNLIDNNDLNFDLSAAMSHEDIGIYFFNGKGIKEYEVNDYGAFFRDFRKEEKEVERVANTFKNAIYELKENVPTH